MSNQSRLFRLLERRPARGAQATPASARMIREGSKTRAILATHPGDEGELGPVVGREGNDWQYPGHPVGAWVGGNAEQGTYNTTDRYLHSGPPPARIARMWSPKVLGRAFGWLTGTESDPAAIGLRPLSGTPDTGMQDGQYIPHIPIPRGAGLSRAYARTVDDAAQVPGVYVADATRR